MRVQLQGTQFRHSVCIKQKVEISKLHIHSNYSYSFQCLNFLSLDTFFLKFPSSLDQDTKVCKSSVTSLIIQVSASVGPPSKDHISPTKHHCEDILYKAVKPKKKELPVCTRSSNHLIQKFRDPEQFAQVSLLCVIAVKPTPKCR